MMDIKEKIKKRIRRHRRVRAKVQGTAEKPRLCVFRSNKHIYAQLIDDDTRKTLVAAKDTEIKKISPEIKKKFSRKVALAYEVGILIAKKAQDLGIKKVVFDRGGYKYHGRVKAVAEGARKGGLKF